MKAKSMRHLCKNEAVLSAYADNELSSRKTRKVYKHLQTCTECQKKLQEIIEMNSLLHALPEMELSPEFDGAIVVKGNRESRAFKNGQILSLKSRYNTKIRCLIRESWMIRTQY